jgi:tRNA modification GTPase
VVDALIELRMFTEATLDFPEEDSSFCRRRRARHTGTIRARLTQIFTRAKQGALLRDGLAVC